MATTRATTNPTFPAFNVPGFNVEALVALQKANIETFVEVQNLVAEAAKAAWALHLKRVDAWKAQTVAAFKGFDVAKKPEAYAKDAQEVVETAFADAKTVVEHGVKTHQEVAKLVTDRVVANINELKTLAA
jgi:hypothetical protein